MRTPIMIPATAPPEIPSEDDEEEEDVKGAKMVVVAVAD